MELLLKTCFIGIVMMFYFSREHEKTENLSNVQYIREREGQLNLELS